MSKWSFIGRQRREEQHDFRGVRLCRYFGQAISVNLLGVRYIRHKVTYFTPLSSPFWNSAATARAIEQALPQSRNRVATDYLK